LNPACNGLGHHLHKDIGCLADTFPATPRSVGATVKVRTQWNQPVLFLAGGQKRTGHGKKADAVRPPQGEHPESAVIPIVGMVKDSRKQLDMPWEDKQIIGQTPAGQSGQAKQTFRLRFGLSHLNGDGAINAGMSEQRHQIVGQPVTPQRIHCRPDPGVIRGQYFQKC
jgi:hypothetical protein